MIKKNQISLILMLSIAILYTCTLVPTIYAQQQSETILVSQKSHTTVMGLNQTASLAQTFKVFQNVYVNLTKVELYLAILPAPNTRTISIGIYEWKSNQTLGKPLYVQNFSRSFSTTYSRYNFTFSKPVKLTWYVTYALVITPVNLQGSEVLAVRINYPSDAYPTGKAYISFNNGPWQDMSSDVYFVLYGSYSQDVQKFMQDLMPLVALAACVGALTGISLLVVKRISR